MVKGRGRPDGDEQPAKRRRVGGGGGEPLPCAVKFLCSRELVAGLIGKGGTAISEMRERCKAKLHFSDSSEVYPGTKFQIFTASAQEEQRLEDVIEGVVAKIRDIAREGTDSEVGYEDNLRIVVLLPRAAVGCLIGKGGANVKQLRESTGTKINIEDASASGPAADQVITISGEEPAVLNAAVEVNRILQGQKDEDWFPGWVTNNPAEYSDGGGGGKGGGRGKRGRDDGIYDYSGGGSQIVGSAPVGRGDWKKSTSRVDSGVRQMQQIAEDLPSYVVEDNRGFALSCIVPNDLVGGLIGRGGHGIREVEEVTGTKIGVREIPGEQVNRSLNISGPLPAACSAYMLMMKRYLDSEAEAAEGSAGNGRRR